MELTQELVKQLFDYHEDGYLIWKVKKHGVKTGTRAGYLNFNKGEYRYAVKVNYKLYASARLIFFYHTGEWPEVVDHKDRDTLNDRIGNLRSATYSQNSMNKTSKRNSSSKYLGVSKAQKRQKWRATIYVKGQKIFLGHYIEETVAALIYNKAAVKYFGEFANLNIIIPSTVQNNF